VRVCKESVNGSVLAVRASIDDAPFSERLLRYWATSSSVKWPRREIPLSWLNRLCYSQSMCIERERERETLIVTAALARRHNRAMQGRHIHSFTNPHAPRMQVGYSSRGCRCDHPISQARRKAINQASKQGPGRDTLGGAAWCAREQQQANEALSEHHSTVLPPTHAIHHVQELVGRIGSSSKRIGSRYTLTLTHALNPSRSRACR